MISTPVTGRIEAIRRISILSRPLGAKTPLLFLGMLEPSFARDKNYNCFNELLRSQVPPLTSDFGIIVHGGAGTISAAMRRDLHLRRKIIENAASAGYSILRVGGSSIDAVESAIKVLEDSDVFNAGAGSSLTIEGRIQPDAAIMKGDLSCGAVGDAWIVKNPISLARAVMEKSDHVLIVGSENLQKFAEATNYPLYKLAPNKLRRGQFRQYVSLMKKGMSVEWPRNSKLLRSYELPRSDASDTVGAVAIDRHGQVAAGVSTGGRFLKLPGRIGDSAVIGAGLYAEASAGAASATGVGEEIIRMTLCKTVCDLLKTGLDAQAACDAAINKMTNARGRGNAGVIAVDTRGGFGYAYNTRMMPHGVFFRGKKPIIEVLPTRKGERTRI